MSEDGHNSIKLSLGNLSLNVQGDDPEWVSETFDEKLDDALEEAEEITEAIRVGSRGHQ